MPIFVKAKDVNIKPIINEEEIFSKNLSINSQNSLERINQLINTKRSINRTKLEAYYNPEKTSSILDQKNLLQIIDRMQQIESGSREEKPLFELYSRKLNETLIANKDFFSDSKFRSEFFENLTSGLPDSKGKNLVTESEALYIQNVVSDIYNQLSNGVNKIIKNLEIPEAKQERFKVDFLRNMNSSISGIAIDAKDAEKNYQSSIANLVKSNLECFDSPDKIHNFLNTIEGLFTKDYSRNTDSKLERLSEMHNKVLDNPDIAFPITLGFLKTNFLEPFEDKLQTTDDNKALFIRDVSQLIAIVPSISEEETTIQEYGAKMKNLLQDHNLIQDRYHIFSLMEDSVLTEKTRQSVKSINSTINREVINEHITAFWKDTFPDKEVPEETISKFTDEILEKKEVPSLEEFVNQFNGFETMKLGDECHKNIKKLQNHLSDVNIGKNTNIADKFLELESKKLYADILQNSRLVANKSRLEELNELQEKYTDTNTDTINKLDGNSVNIGDIFKEQLVNEEKVLSDFSEGLYTISKHMSKYIDFDNGTVKNINNYSSNFAIQFLKDDQWKNFNQSNRDEFYTIIENNIENPYREQFNKAHQLVEDHIKSRIAILDLQAEIKTIEPELKSHYIKTQNDLIRDKFKKFEIEDTVFASREATMEHLFELQEMRNDIAKRCDKTSKNYERFSNNVERTKSALTDRYNKFDTKEYKYGKESAIYKLIMGLKTDTLVKVLQNTSEKEQDKMDAHEFILDKKDFYLNSPPELASKMHEVVYQANATKADSKIYSVIDCINKICTEIIKFIEHHSDKAIINLEEIGKGLSINGSKVDKLAKFIEDINQENLNKVFNQIESNIVGISRADFKHDTNEFKISQRPEKDEMDRIISEIKDLSPLVPLTPTKPLENLIDNLSRDEDAQFKISNAELDIKSNYEVLGGFTRQEMQRRSRDAAAAKGR